MVVVAGLSAAATIQPFTNQTTWQTLVGGTITFSFNNFNASSGPTTISLTPTNTNGFSGLNGGLWRDLLATGTLPNPVESSVPSTTLVSWSGGPMTAVGGDWNTAIFNEGGKINIVLNLVGGGTQLVQTIGPINGFFGWISDTPFDSFVLSTNNNLFDNFDRPYGIEHYTLDNFQIAVPEPATLSMVGLLLLGLGGIRRFRRS